MIRSSTPMECGFSAQRNHFLKRMANGMKRFTKILGVVITFVSVRLALRKPQGNRTWCMQTADARLVLQ
ncbi:hypothetical protein Y695_01676 [Hydrogenophaga sp. T4]|nr:hypothetical protein Y695_01676 [Hydrogenophaga sp. T4]